ncbi:ycgE-like transcriptional regulator [Actinoplanes sp. SE50]|nr:ycgE-like uncharacterized HTH-type transcriptional regulator [Actinoplanes sp. SE50/110]ATO79552.1 ycgE-like transcriptional regulator [Actinoplanes sp. SE50]SLL96953.1 MerR-family transcriptional regulator [Actinoplanes sp. SE50/110]
MAGEALSAEIPTSPGSSVASSHDIPATAGPGAVRTGPVAAAPGGPSDTPLTDATAAASGAADDASRARPATATDDASRTGPATAATDSPDDAVRTGVADAAPAGRAGDVALSAGAAARRLGVAVTTLRTWHQRYGLGPSRHEPGHHRRYTAEDMDRLQVMQRLTTQGVAPAEAAAWARSRPLTPPEPGAALYDPTAVASPPTPAAPGQPPVGPAGRGTRPTRGPAPAARGLTRAAMRLDVRGMRDILCSTLHDRGVIPAWTEVMVPALAAIGDRYEATRRFVEVEHLLSRAVTEILASVPHPAGSPRVLLAAADEEQHTLPLEALAAALAEGGVPSRLFGARVPSQALLDAIARTGPAAVVLWSQRPATGIVTQLTRVRDIPHPPLVIAAAGPGWPHDLPSGITRLTGLTEAVHLLATV